MDSLVPAAGPSAAEAYAAPLKERLSCPNCGPEPDTVEDFAAGDVICSSCGIILQNIIDWRSEWRTFSNDNTPHKDPSRVGGPANPLLPESALTTGISKTDGSQALSRWQTRVQSNGSERSLKHAFKEISNLAGRMSLPTSIMNKACELYKDVEGQKSFRGRSTNGLIAAAVYSACRLEGVPRTFKEICNLTNTEKKDVGRAFKFMRKHSEVLAQNLSIISTSNFNERFCNKLGMSIQETKLAGHIAEEAVRLGIVAGKCPVSVAAAAIYMVTQLSVEKKVQKADIGNITGASEVTIRNSYKDLYAHRSRLLPPDSPFAKVVDMLPPS